MTNDEGMTKPEATLRQLRLNRFNGLASRSQSSL